MMQIRVRVRVRCTRVTSPESTPGWEGATALAARSNRQCASARRARGDAHRTAGLHAHTGGGSARREPLNLRPAHPAS